MKMHIHRGFTIIELMITILLLGVMATLAVPSFSGILKQNRLSAQTNTILSALNYARNETINQNNNVVIAPTVAGTDWSGGWSVRLNSAAGAVLHSFEGFKNATVASDVSTIIYQPDGTTQSGAVINIDITPSKCPTGKNDVRRITISPSGQSRSSHLACA